MERFHRIGSLTIVRARINTNKPNQLSEYMVLQPKYTIDLPHHDSGGFDHGDVIESNGFGFVAHTATGCARARRRTPSSRPRFRGEGEYQSLRRRETFSE